LTDLALIVGFIIAPFLAIGMLRKWEYTLFTVMILMVFEGALRKWLLPQFETQIYLLKDALVLVAFFGFMSTSRPVGSHERMMQALKLLIIINVFMCFLQLSNPASPSFLVAIIGVKNYVLYMLVAFMVPYAFSSGEDLERKLKIFMFLMIPVCVLGLVQFFSPPDSFINVYVKRGDEEQFVSRVGEGGQFVRATGTFSYIGGYSTFIFTMFFFSLAFIIGSRKNLAQLAIPLALLIGASMSMFTTGSRTVVFGIGLLAPLVLLLNLKSGVIDARMMIRLLSVIALAVGIVGYYGTDAVDAFSHRAGNSDSAVMRFFSPVTETMGALDVSPIFGYGPGSTHGSAATIMGDKTYWWLDNNFFEVEPARIMQETGIFGFVIVFALRIYLTVMAISFTFRLRTPLFKALSAAIAGFFVLHLGMFVVSNPTAGLFYWFSAGLLLAMYRLETSPAEVRMAAGRPVHMQMRRGARAR
jgi:O-antigen ligase